MPSPPSPPAPSPPYADGTGDVYDPVMGEYRLSMNLADWAQLWLIMLVARHRSNASVHEAPKDITSTIQKQDCHLDTRIHAN